MTLISVSYSNIIYIYTIPILTWDCIYSKYYKLFVLVEKH